MMNKKEKSSVFKTNGASLLDHFKTLGKGENRSNADFEDNSNEELNRSD